MSKKYASLNTLQTFLDNLKNLFATQATVDVLEQSIDGKADSSHYHAISEVTDLQTNLDTINDALEQKSQVQVVEDGSSEILPTLMIHKLTQEEYDQEVANGTVDANAIYLTPEEEIDLSNYATIEQLANKADAKHNHDDVYYTESEVDTLLSSKSDTTHNHDSDYDKKGSADSALASAKEYTDSAVSGLASASHSHDDTYYTESEIDQKIDVVNESINSKLDSSVISNYSTTEESQAYIDSAVAQKSQVQIITWEADD